MKDGTLFVFTAGIVIGLALAALTARMGIFTACNL